MDDEISDKFEQLKVKTTRKLASVQIISSVSRHPKSTIHSIVKLLGWQVVTKKDEFKQGQN